MTQGHFRKLDHSRQAGHCSLSRSRKTRVLSSLRHRKTLPVWGRMTDISTSIIQALGVDGSGVVCEYKRMSGR